MQIFVYSFRIFRVSLRVFEWLRERERKRVCACVCVCVLKQTSWDLKCLYLRVEAIIHLTKRKSKKKKNRKEQKNCDERSSTKVGCREGRTWMAFFSFLTLTFFEAFQKFQIVPKFILYFQIGYRSQKETKLYFVLNVDLPWPSLQAPWPQLRYQDLGR